jgi:hypothetical protein
MRQNLINFAFISLLLKPVLRRAPAPAVRPAEPEPSCAERWAQHYSDRDAAFSG